MIIKTVHNECTHTNLDQAELEEEISNFHPHVLFLADSVNVFRVEVYLKVAWKNRELARIFAGWRAELVEFLKAEMGKGVTEVISIARQCNDNDTADCQVRRL